MANEKVKISLPVVPTLDRRAARTVTAEIQDLERQLGPIKVSFDHLAKTASSSVKELSKVSSAASGMSKSIAQAVKQAKSEVGSLNKTLQGVKGGRGGGGSGGDEDAADAQQELTDTTEDLSDAMNNLLKSTKSQADASKRAAKAQSDMAKAMKQRSKEKFEGFGDIMKDLPNLFKKGSMGGGLKGVGGGLGKMFGVTPGGPTAGAKAVSAAGGGGGGAAAAGGGAAGGGAMASAAGALMKAGPYIAAAAAAIMAIAKILEMASQSQTKINKAMLDGVGFANDFGVSVQGYRDGIDELRDAIQDTSFTMLKFGGNSEQTAKIINRFTKEATGSLMQTRNELSQMPGGLQVNVAAMAKAATAYGKALGMEAEEAAAMMGRFKNELGLSAQGSMDAMQNIVKAASQSNMPMTKFMEIFHRVIPDIELYQNRLEELTGTVKLLSKTMSAKDVKNFMDAFSKGFKGTDFKQRLKTTLVAGVGNVSGALEKDFDAKARSMAKNFAEYGIDEQQFVDAMKGGEKTMSALVNKAQAAASQQGKQLGGTQISDAMKLAGYEQTRQKGGALNVATAMSGAGTMATYNILKQFGGTLTKGFDGISEHVMKQLGISEQQYEALRTTSQSLRVQKDQLKTFGKTNSKSMNAALRETVKLRKKGMTEADIEEAMRNATDDELFAAAERQKENTKDQEKAFDLASEQYNVTTSIGDKLDNVISFLLEQMLRVLNPILDVLNDIFMRFVSGDSKEAKRMLDLTGNVKKLFPQIKGMPDEFNKQNAVATEMVDQVGNELSKQLGAGRSGDDLADSIAKSGVLGDLGKKLPSLEEMRGIFEKRGMDKKDIDAMFNKYYSAKDDTEKLKALTAAPGSLQDNIMELTQFMASHPSLHSDKAKDAADARSGRASTVKKDAKSSMTAQQRTAAIQAGQASDIEALGPPIADGKGGKGGMSEEEYKKAAAFMGMTVDAYKKMESGGAKGGDLKAATGPVDQKAALDAMAQKMGQKSGADLSPEVKKQLGVTDAQLKEMQAQKASPAASADLDTKAASAMQKDSHAAVQDTAKIAADQSKTVEDQLKIQEDAYQASTDVLSLLKKGIKYEQSWLGTKYKNVLKDATLESFRTALVEFAVLQAKMQTDSEFTKNIADNAWNIANRGGAAMSEMHLAKKGDDHLSKLVGYQVGEHYATGGSVDYDQMAKVHKGEFVVPKGGMLVKGGDGGSKTVNVNATINVHTDADPKQIAAEVHNLYRAH